MNICIFQIQQKENGLEIELKKMKMVYNLLKMEKAILNKIIQAEGFEKFLHTKYVGTKRFGLDGAESFNSCFRTNNKNWWSK